MSAEPIIRNAIIAQDAFAISQVYAHHVLHGTGTFEEHPPSAAAIADRMEAALARGWPWLVAHLDGTIAGYAYCTQFRDRAAYRHSCESSIYVREDRMGRGVGRALLAALIVAAAEHGFRRMFAVIGDSANAGSIALHARQGFTHAGILHDAGLKFGRNLDVVFMERAIG